VLRRRVSGDAARVLGVKGINETYVRVLEKENLLERRTRSPNPAET